MSASQSATAIGSSGGGGGGASLLKQWFLGDAAAGGGARTSATATTLPRILVLDGGVSTHLEQQQEEEQAKNKAAAAAAAGEATASSSSAAFPHRELWSSGLLLSGAGRRRIRRGHLDWLRGGAANVISTATYQCHYEARLWPQQLLLPKEEQQQQQQQQEQQEQQQQSLRMTDAVMDQMWKDGIDLARQAVADYESSEKQQQQQPRRPHFVVASSGCYGAALANGAEYTGDYGFPDETSAAKSLIRFHRRKWRAAARHRPDGIAIETVPSLAECRALRDLLLSLNDDDDDDDDDNTNNNSHANVACYVSLACRNGRELNDGSPLQEALDVLARVPGDRLQAIGLNCCAARHLPALLDVLVADLASRRRRRRDETGCCSANNNSGRGIVIFPNSGEAWDAERETWVAGTGVTESSAMAQRLLEAVRHIEEVWRRTLNNNNNNNNATPPLPSILVGGCCRTTPATIAALSQRIDEHLAQESE